MNPRIADPVPMRLPGARENYGMPYSRSPRIWLSVFQFRSSILSKLLVSFVAITAFAVAVIGVVEYFVAKDVVEIGRAQV